MAFEVVAATLRCNECGLERKMRLVSDGVGAEYSSKSQYSVKVKDIFGYDEEEQYIFTVGGPEHRCGEGKTHFVYGTPLW